MRAGLLAREGKDDSFPLRCHRSKKSSDEELTKDPIPIAVTWRPTIAKSGQESSHSGAVAQAKHAIDRLLAVKKQRLDPPPGPD
jgi:hypothetical protein